MKANHLFLIIGLILIAGPGIASAAIPVNASDISTNYIMWSWGSGLTLTGINVDGKLISTFDPLATSYILTGTSPKEIHSITIYAMGGDSGSNTTSTSPEPLGDLPLGIWIYGIPAVLFIIFARMARVAALNTVCIMFSLFGLYQLINVKDVMDGNLWTFSLLYFFVIMVAGVLSWAQMSGRVFGK